MKKSKFKQPLEFYIKNCLEYLKSDSFENAWIKGFCLAQGEVKFSAEERNLIECFGRTLGKSDVVSQVNNCSSHINLAKNYLKKAIEENGKKGKLPLVLGVGLGLIIFVLAI